jgi:glycosyltransferase involved in cell wall biosynthesis
MQKCAVWSAVGLAGRGHHVRYLAGYGPVDPVLSAGGSVEVVCMGYEERSARGNRKDMLQRMFGNPETAEAMARMLEGLDPSDTVIHVHDVDRIVTSRPIQVAMERGFRVVMTLHSYALACPNGAFYNFRRDELCTLRPGSMACMLEECTGHGRATKIGHLVKFLVNRRRGMPGRLAHIICVSEFSRRLHEPHLSPESKVHVVPNHVDFLEGPRVEAERNRIFTYVGRIVPEKGPVVLARAARLAGVPVKFVGDGTDADRVREANPDAIVTGWLPPDEVHRELEAARAICMVSRWYEGLPLVVGEGLAKGLPVIVSDSCAAQEVVIDGETGLKFASGNAEDLSQKLAMLADDALVERLSRNAYDRFWQSPQTLDRHLDALEEVYRQAVS